MGEYDVFKDEYAPETNKAQTVGGEIIRATMHIYDKWVRSHKKLGVAYGGEYVNYAGRYLGEACKGTSVEEVLDVIWGMKDDRLYERGIRDLMKVVSWYLSKHLELFDVENDKDMWDFCMWEDFDGLWPEEEEEVEEEYNHQHPWAVYDPQ